VSQWKLGANYSPVDDIRIRGTYSESVRAPNIIELFAPQGENFTQAQQDPCDRANVTQGPNRAANCARDIPGYNAATFNSNIGTGRSSLRLLQGGNPDLQEETAETYTIGAVIQPRFVDNLAITVDYYDIKIEDAVSLPDLGSIFRLCYDNGLSAFCNLINRDPTGARTSVVGGVDFVQQTQANVAALVNRGIDFSIQYSDLDIAGLTGQDADFGNLGLTFQGTYVFRSDFVGLPGSIPSEFAGTVGTPRWKLSGTASWGFGPLTLSWQTRFESSVVADQTLLPLINGAVTRDPFYTGDYWSHDLRALYALTDSLTLRAGVLNVTDEIPPQVPGINTGTGQFSGGYDNRGRYFYAGVNVKF
jgi:outer membrane receptor protein involved in Fe transport